MRTVIRMLHEAAGKYPQRAYMTKKGENGWQPYSFDDVDQLSAVVATYLLAQGTAPGTTFGILAEGRLEWVVAELGVIKARGISVPLSIKLTPDEIAFRLEHSEADGIFVSSNTLNQVCQALQGMENKPTIYYLDEHDERLSEKIAIYQWKAGEDYLVWNNLISLGKDIFEHQKTLIGEAEEQIDENDTINICYTSGTTGNPKGIMLTHLNYWANSHDSVALFDIPHEVFETLIVLPVDHSFAHTVGIYTALLRGITLHFVDARGSNAAILRNFPKNLVEVNPVYMMTVPSITGNFMKKMTQGVAQKGKLINGIFQRGLQAGIRRNGDGFKRPPLATKITTFFPYALASLLVFPSLRKVFGNRMQYCVGGGALLEAKQQHFFAAIGVPVYQGYGLTEAAPVISSNTPERHKFGTSGVVAPSVKCRIMKSDTEEAKVGERGEIVIQGENVMKGYFKNPEASSDVLREEADGTWLWTGDLGYYDEDGFLVVTGRAKALLIAKDGEKYSPEEVEEVMINHGEIFNQVLVYNDHKTFTSALVTLNDDVVQALLKSEKVANAEELTKRIIEELRGYEEYAGAIPQQWIPGRFALIEKPFSEADGLVNSTMKLVRYKVIEFYQKRIDQIYVSETENFSANVEVVKKLYFS